MSVEDLIRQEVRPRLRMTWDGVTLAFNNDVTADEIDGVIRRLEHLKTKLKPKESGIIVMDAKGVIIPSEAI